MTPDRFHLVISPQPTATPELIRKIATIVGLLPYDVGLKARTVLPRPLATFPDLAVAVRAGTELGALGVKNAVFAESRLPPAAPVLVRRWQWSGSDLTVTDRRDRVVELKQAELAFVAFGYRVATHMESHLETNVRIGYRGTTDTSYSVVKVRKKDLPLFALLSPLDEDREALLFDASALDFQCLPGRREPSENTSMRKLHVLMEQAWPDVAIDRHLLEHRIDPESHLYFNRRTCDDAAVAASYLLWYLRCAEVEAGGFYNSMG